MAILLSRLVEPKFLEERSFTYQRAHLKKRGSDVDFRLNQYEKMKVYTYFQDPATQHWRYGEEPHHTKGQMAVMAAATAALTLATLSLRIIQLAVILTGVFFRAYKASFSQKEAPNFSEIFFNTIELKIQEQFKEFGFIGRSLCLDLRCSSAMFVSACVASFSNEMNKVLQMEVIFSEMEQRWNKGPDFDIESSGNESSWHADNAAIANWALYMKTHDLKQMNFQQLIGELSKVRERSNKTFYIYQCAQPLSKRFESRLKWIEGDFDSYSALVKHYEAQAKRLTRL